MIALFLDREFNPSRKYLEVPIREKLDSRNIWHIQYTCMTEKMKFNETPHIFASLNLTAHNYMLIEFDTNLNATSISTTSRHDYVHLTSISF